MSLLILFGGPGSGTNGVPFNEFAGGGGTIAGAVNGVNTGFTLSNPPTSSASVEVFKDGLYQRQGTDYTIAGSVFTFTVAPPLGSFIDVFYDK